MKILSWKIWLPIMVICVVGFGLTGPAVKQQAKSQVQIETPKREFKSGPKFKSGPGKSGRMSDLEIEVPAPKPVPSPPPPIPEKSNVLSSIFFYGSGISILLNLLNLLEKTTGLIGRILKK